jgi:methionyl-tRNA formyltransferase
LVHDLVRMLDGEGYPSAFLKAGRLRLEFTRASRKVDHVAADVRIYLDPEGGDS